MYQNEDIQLAVNKERWKTGKADNHASKQYSSHKDVKFTQSTSVPVFCSNDISKRLLYSAGRPEIKTANLNDPLFCTYILLCFNMFLSFYVVSIWLR